jgi:hypothetical protein
VPTFVFWTVNSDAPSTADGFVSDAVELGAGSEAIGTVAVRQAKTKGTRANSRRGVMT